MGEHQGPPHRNDIQGLRAVAVLLVALGHAGVPFLSGGFVGVDVFFVVSGFLITGLLLSRGTARRSKWLVDFYSRRAKRILPAAALTLVVTDVVAYRLLNFVRAKQFLTDSLSGALFTANIHFADQGTDYFQQSQPPSPLQHFWSLAVEEQFYLVWPVVLSLFLFGVALRRRAGRAHRSGRPSVTSRDRRRLLVTILLVAAASLAWSIHDTSIHPAAAYFSTFARAWELALGAALAISAPKLRRVHPAWRVVTGWLGVISIATAGVAFSSTTAFPGFAAFLPTAGAALVIAAGIAPQTPRLAVGRILSIAPLRFIGDRSYSFYLWHWPVLTIVEEYEGHGLSLPFKLLLLSAAFVLSACTYALIENPIRRYRWPAPRYALLLWPISTLAVIIVAGIGVTSIEVRANRLAAVGAPQYPGLSADYAQGSKVTSATVSQLSTAPGSTALPAVIAAVHLVQRGAPIPAALTPPVGSLLSDHYNYPSGCTANDGQSSSSICRLGDFSAAKSLVVLGDSHAEMWMPPILAMAARDKWVVHPIGKSACIPLEWWQVTPATPDCRAWFRWAITQIQKLHPTVTLIAGAFAGLVGKLDAATLGISSLITDVKHESGHVVVMADQPSQHSDPIDCLLAPNTTMARCALEPSSEEVAVGEAIAAAAKQMGASYINTQSWFCFDNFCPMVIGHTIVYRDVGHVTATYASELDSVFRAAFREAIGRSSGT